MRNVGERPWWRIHRPNSGRKKKVKGEEEREVRSSLLLLDLKDGKYRYSLSMLYRHNSEVATHNRLPEINDTLGNGSKVSSILVIFSLALP